MNPMIEMLDKAFEDVAANLAFGLIVLGVIAALVLLALFTSLLIRYTIRSIRRWFVENVVLRKVETDHKSFRRV